MPKKNRIIIKIFFLLMIVAAVLFFAFDLSGEGSKEKNQAEIIFLDVGQGDAILIQSGETQILIDGGDGEYILERLGEEMPFGDRKVEMLINTHTDDDHLGGLLKVLESYDVGQMLQTGILCDEEICWRRDELISENDIEVITAKLGQEVRIGEDVDLKILYPFSDSSGKEFDNANDMSVVIRAEVAGVSHLLTGDISSDIEEELVSGGLDLDVDILKVAHHGSKYSSSTSFLEAVSPEKAIISVGDNSYGHPTEEVINRLENMNIEVFRTDERGSVKF